MDEVPENQETSKLNPKAEGGLRDALRDAGIEDVPQNPLFTKNRQDIAQVLERSGLEVPNDPLPPEHRTPATEAFIRNQLKGLGYGRKDMEEALRRAGFEQVQPRKQEVVEVHTLNNPGEGDKQVKIQEMRPIDLTRPVVVKPLNAPGAVVRKDGPEPPASSSRK